jgi:D-alanyl-lipoteichoic acid acyltransferase DltB (MBOAT superfamily)
MEIMLHYIYVNAILKASPEWLIYTPFEISMLAYFKLKFTWLKLLIIWRFSRFWALMDGIDPPENLLRCMTNNFSVLGFWRGWHRSFNRWVIRYIYLPAGGGTLNISRRSSTSLGHHTFRVHARQVGILFVVFTFSAIWHEINLRLLLWGWLITIFLLPETILVRWASVKNWPSQHAALHFLVSVGGATNIITMIFANLVGFSGQGSDLKGLIYQVMSSWSGWSFLLRAILICSVGVQVMLKIRNEESRRGIYLRC